MAVSLLEYDEVFTEQSAFRALLDSLARPGKINRLPGVDLKIPIGVNPYLVQIALTLLDQETTFAVAGSEAERLAGYLRIRTGSRLTETGRAEFLLAEGERPVPEMALLSPGSLEFPERGATVILAVGRLGSEPGETKEKMLKLELSGPGIPVTRRLYAEGLNQINLEALVEQNREYPLGVDLFLVDSSGQVAGLPRTVSLSWGVKD